MKTYIFPDYPDHSLKFKISRHHKINRFGEHFISCRIIDRRDVCVGGFDIITPYAGFADEFEQLLVNALKDYVDSSEDDSLVVSDYIKTGKLSKNYSLTD